MTLPVRAESTIPIASAAREWAARIPVFPCHPSAKHPATPRGFHDATRDVHQIDAWWSENPAYNIAACPDDGGYCVLDIDGDEGEESLKLLEAMHGPLTPTFIVRTPRGGRHLWFRGSLPSTAGKLGAKIDTRGIGGYVLLPGSRIDGREYLVIGDHKIAPVPEWIAPLLKRQEPTQGPADVPLDQVHNVARAREYLRVLVEQGDVAVEGKGGDAFTYEKACKVRGFGLSEETVLDLLAQEFSPRCNPPWERDELTVKVRNAFAYCQNDGYADWIPTAEDTFAHFLDQCKANEQEGAKGKDRFDIVSAGAVTPKHVDWVWQDRVAVGKLGIIAGSPGQGKSQLSFYIAATVSKGGRWIDGGNAPNGRVIVLSSEDGIEDTMVPRLIAAGADLSKVHFLRATIDADTRRAFSLRSDLNELGKLVSAYGDVVLLVIDPITSYMGDRVDSHQTSQVRAVLDPVSDWAERHNVAVLGVSHPPKASQSNALNAVTGSLAFVGVARLVFVAISDASWPGRSLLLPVKNNLGPRAVGLRYHIEGTEIDGAGGKIKAPRIAWDTSAPVTVTADEAIVADREAKGGPSKAKQAEQFLREQLADGPRAVGEIQEAAKDEKFGWRTVETAKGQLGVQSRKDGTGGWVWELPGKADQQRGGYGWPL